MKQQLNKIELYSANGKLKYSCHSTWNGWTDEYKHKEIVIDPNDDFIYKVLVNNIEWFFKRNHLLFKIYAKKIEKIPNKTN